MSRPTVREPRASEPQPGIFITRTEPPAGLTRLAVKDLFNTAGVRTTYGSALFVDHVPERTATAVRLLEQAGWGSVGKTNLHEFAWGITSDNPHFGRVPNPIAPTRCAGGSSGGNAAALAAGWVEGALGTDSGGSVRVPASWCGVVGFKPTHGRVPVDGCFPLAPSYDHVGPMAPDVAGCIALMRALAPDIVVPDVRLRDVRVGVAWTEHADPLVARRITEAAGLVPRVRLRWLPLPGELTADFAREAIATHADLWPSRSAHYGANVAHKLARAHELRDADVELARRRRASYQDQFEAAFGDLDVVLTPTTAMVAPPAGADDLVIRARTIRLTSPLNATGAPALAMPCGPAELGLPASLQVVARPHQDGLVLAVARELEKALRESCARGSVSAPVQASAKRHAARSR